MCVVTHCIWGKGTWDKTISNCVEIKSSIVVLCYSRLETLVSQSVNQSVMQSGSLRTRFVITLKVYLSFFSV